MRKTHVLLVAVWIALTSLVCASSTHACNIPVFRYALERWQPDPSEIMVFHRGELSQSHQRFVDSLRKKTSELDGPANAKLVVCELDSFGDGAKDEQLQAWDSVSSVAQESLPYVVVRSTIGHGQKINPWHGSLDDAMQAGLFDSPVRQELGKRLLAGHSVVWLLVKSTDAERNESAIQLMKQSFDDLSQSIALPEGIGLPGSELHSEVPLLVQFSMIELDPSDQREQLLVRWLQGFRPAAVEDAQPLVVPVFGRGRALEVIPADQLSPRLMKDLSLFLSGACSCQVKEQNPGFDLLMNVDWDVELFGEDGIRPPPTKPGRNRPQQPELLTIPRGRSR